jgi:hypothetical protein
MKGFTKAVKNCLRKYAKNFNTSGLNSFSNSFVIESVAFYTTDRISADAVIIFREAVKK